MPDEPELLTARGQLVHGLANSVAVLATNVELLPPFLGGAEGLSMLVDIESSIRSMFQLFDDLHEGGDLNLEARWKMINGLANALSIISLNLTALDRHVTHHREGRSIYADMLIANARARTQFEALRKMI